MFYQNAEFSPCLRFGDIIEGFQLFKPCYQSTLSNKLDLSLSVESIAWFSILTPCCSIEKNIISICPLRYISPRYFDNPYLVEDLTNINRIMLPQNSLAPEIWETLPPEEIDKRIGAGPSYFFINYFIYAEDIRLSKYTLTHPSSKEKIETGFYAIDFKEAFPVSSTDFTRGKPYPKILELSKRSREELRNKVAFFYGRPPEEDRI